MEPASFTVLNLIFVLGLFCTIGIIVLRELSVIINKAIDLLVFVVTIIFVFLLGSSVLNLFLDIIPHLK